MVVMITAIATISSKAHVSDILPYPRSKVMTGQAGALFVVSQANITQQADQVRADHQLNLATRLPHASSEIVGNMFLPRCHCQDFCPCVPTVHARCLIGKIFAYPPPGATYGRECSQCNTVRNAVPTKASVIRRPGVAACARTQHAGHAWHARRFAGQDVACHLHYQVPISSLHANVRERRHHRILASRSSDTPQHQL